MQESQRSGLVLGDPGLDQGGPPPSILSFSGICLTFLTFHSFSFLLNSLPLSLSVSLSLSFISHHLPFSISIFLPPFLYLFPLPPPSCPSLKLGSDPRHDFFSLPLLVWGIVNECDPISSSAKRHEFSLITTLSAKALWELNMKMLMRGAHLHIFLCWNVINYYVL